MCLQTILGMEKQWQSALLLTGYLHLSLWIVHSFPVEVRLGHVTFCLIK